MSPVPTSTSSESSTSTSSKSSTSTSSDSSTLTSCQSSAPGSAPLSDKKRDEVTHNVNWTAPPWKKARYSDCKFTLNDEFLEAIQHPLCPTHFAHPGLPGDCDDGLFEVKPLSVSDGYLQDDMDEDKIPILDEREKYDTPFSRSSEPPFPNDVRRARIRKLFDQPVIHQVTPIQIEDVEERLYDPLREFLKRSHDYGAAEGGFDSYTEPHKSSVKRTARSPAHRFESGLFKLINGIFKLAPTPLALVHRRGCNHGLKGLWIDEAEVSHFDGVISDRERRLRQHKQGGAVPKREEDTVCLVIQHEPLLTMEACQHIRDTPGVPQHPGDGWGACPVKLLQRARYRALQGLAHQMIQTGAAVGVIFTGAELLVFERDLDYDLRLAQRLAQGQMPSSEGCSIWLKSWDVSFAHPLTPRFDPRHPPQGPRFREDNFTCVFAGLLVYAEKLVQQRLAQGLDGLKQLIPTRPPRPTSLELLQEITSVSGDSCIQTHEGAAPSSARSAVIPCDVIVACGTLSESPVKHYLLICYEFYTSHGKTIQAYHGNVYFYEGQLPHRLGWKTTQVLPTDALRNAVAEKVDCSPGRLYRARGEVAVDIIEQAFRLIAGGATNGEVVLKLPRLIAKKQDHLDKAAWRWSRRPCYLCFRDESPDFLCEEQHNAIARAFRKEAETFAGLQEAKANGDAESAPEAQPASTVATENFLLPLLFVKMSCRLPLKQADEQAWPHFSTLYAERDYPVIPEGGPTLGGVMNYSDACWNGPRKPYWRESCGRTESYQQLLEYFLSDEGYEDLHDKAKQQLAIIHKKGWLHGSLHAYNLCVKLKKVPLPQDGNDGEQNGGPDDGAEGNGKDDDDDDDDDDDEHDSDRDEEDHRLKPGVVFKERCTYELEVRIIDFARGYNYNKYGNMSEFKAHCKRERAELRRSIDDVRDTLDKPWKYRPS